MARVLVTASLGNVGREVVRECVASGFVVRVADRDRAKAEQHFPGMEATALDFFKPSTWATALEGCDFVFLLRPPPVGDMKTTLNPFIDAAWAAGVRHIVFLSVAGADTMKWVPHRKVELHLQASGNRWTVLRPGFFAQNLQDAYLRDIKEDGRIYVPAGKGRVAFIDVSDVAAVAAQVFLEPERHQGQALTLTGPVALTFDEVASTLEQALHRPVKYEAASVLGYARHLRTARGMPWMQIVIQTILHFGLRGGDAEKVEPTVEAMLGRPPRSMKEYVQRSVATWAG